MADLNPQEEAKLIELLSAVEAVLTHFNTTHCLDQDTIGQLAAMADFIRAWLAGESEQEAEQRVETLAAYTATLAKNMHLLAAQEAQAEPVRH